MNPVEVEEEVDAVEDEVKFKVEMEETMLVIMLDELFEEDTTEPELELEFDDESKVEVECKCDVEVFKQAHDWTKNNTSRAVCAQLLNHLSLLSVVIVFTVMLLLLIPFTGSFKSLLLFANFCCIA
jgi:hypothetical protein